MSQPEGDYRLLPIGQVIPSRDNPRQNHGPLNELRDSIKENGILEPLLVMNGPPFLLIAGERRWAAAKLAGLTEVPCIVRPMSQPARRVAMIVENLQRRGLEPIEEAEAYRQLVESGRSQREIAISVGKSQAHVSRRLLLLELPKAVQKQVAARTLPIDRALGYEPKPAAALTDEGSSGPDIFEADEALDRAWRELRQDTIDSGDRRSIQLLGAFAKAFKAYRTMLEASRPRVRDAS